MSSTELSVKVKSLILLAQECLCIIWSHQRSYFQETQSEYLHANPLDFPGDMWKGFGLDTKTLEDIRLKISDQRKETNGCPNLWVTERSEDRYCHCPGIVHGIIQNTWECLAQKQVVINIWWKNIYAIVWGTHCLSVWTTCYGLRWQTSPSFHNAKGNNCNSSWERKHIIQRAWWQSDGLKTVSSGGRISLSFEERMAAAIERILLRAEAGRISIWNEVLK